MKKVVLITGASSGMGKSTAILLNSGDYKVYGAARRTDKMTDLKTKGISIIPLDLTNNQSIENCVNTILAQEHKIDILINNAGYGSYGAIEDVPLTEARRQFEVNIFGLARITQLILPSMRKQKSGRIVNISSMGGKVYTPLGAWYFATKHALEAWSDCLRLEVKEFNIKVVLIEPGAIKTPWGTIAAENLKKYSAKGAYTNFANKVAQKLIHFYTNSNITSPDKLAKIITKAATIKKPKNRYLKGYMAKTSVWVRKWLGDNIYDKILMSQFK